MKKIFLMIFVVGLFAVGISASPDLGARSNVQTVFVRAVDQVQAPVMNAVDEVVLQAPEDPVSIKWIDENFWNMISGLVLLFYEFLALKLPTSKSVSIIGNLYKLLTWFFPDKSKNGGIFTIGNKF
jgi:hypothetical protein